MVRVTNMSRRNVNGEFEVIDNDPKLSSSKSSRKRKSSSSTCCGFLTRCALWLLFAWQMYLLLVVVIQTPVLRHTFNCVTSLHWQSCVDAASIVYHSGAIHHHHFFSIATSGLFNGGGFLFDMIRVGYYASAPQTTTVPPETSIFNVKQQNGVISTPPPTANAGLHVTFRPNQKYQTDRSAVIVVYSATSRVSNQLLTSHHAAKPCQVSPSSQRRAAVKEDYLVSASPWMVIVYDRHACMDGGFTGKGRADDNDHSYMLSPPMSHPQQRHDCQFSVIVASIDGACQMITPKSGMIKDLLPSVQSNLMSFNLPPSSIHAVVDVSYASTYNVSFKDVVNMAFWENDALSHWLSEYDLKYRIYGIGGGGGERDASLADTRAAVVWHSFLLSPVDDEKAAKHKWTELQQAFPISSPFASQSVPAVSQQSLVASHIAAFFQSSPLTSFSTRMSMIFDDRLVFAVYARSTSTMEKVHYVSSPVLPDGFFDLGVGEFAQTALQSEWEALLPSGHDFNQWFRYFYVIASEKMSRVMNAYASTGAAIGGMSHFVDNRTLLTEKQVEENEMDASLSAILESAFMPSVTQLYEMSDVDRSVAMNDVDRVFIQRHGHLPTLYGSWQPPSRLKTEENAKSSHQQRVTSTSLHIPNVVVFAHTHSMNERMKPFHLPVDPYAPNRQPFAIDVKQTLYDIGMSCSHDTSLDRLSSFSSKLAGARESIDEFYAAGKVTASPEPSRLAPPPPKQPTSFTEAPLSDNIYRLQSPTLGNCVALADAMAWYYLFHYGVDSTLFSHYTAEESVQLSRPMSVPLTSSSLSSSTNCNTIPSKAWRRWRREVMEAERNPAGFTSSFAVSPKSSFAATWHATSHQRRAASPKTTNTAFVATPLTSVWPSLATLEYTSAQFAFSGTSASSGPVSSIAVHFFGGTSHREGLSLSYNAQEQATCLEYQMMPQDQPWEAQSMPESCAIHPWMYLITSYATEIVSTCAASSR